MILRSLYDTGGWSNLIYRKDYKDSRAREDGVVLSVYLDSILPLDERLPLRGLRLALIGFEFQDPHIP